MARFAFPDSGTLTTPFGIGFATVDFRPNRLFLKTQQPRDPAAYAGGRKFFAGFNQADIPLTNADCPSQFALCHSTPHPIIGQLRFRNQYVHLGIAV